MHSEPCLILHGGAGRFSKEHGNKKLPVLEEAASAAWKLLESGNSSEDAVCAALRIMEGSQYFNAGYGGYPNQKGVVLLDVGLMRGNGDFISLLNVRKLKYPSAAAKRMLAEGESLISVWTHELMTEVEHAPDEIKREYGLVGSHQELIAPFVKELLAKKGFEVDAAERSRTKLAAGATDVPEGGTVGCVARDRYGKIFAGTSTGGTSMKDNGRIGDSPIIGAGVFADDEICGLSTTGHGESFMRVMCSGFIVAEMRRELRGDPDVFRSSPQKLKRILDEELTVLQSTEKGRGAIIVLPASGPPAFSCNAQKVAVAVKLHDQPIHVQIAEQGAAIA